VHYVNEGRGETIVLIHGFASLLHTWNRVADKLKRDHRVIRVDLPPFGVTGPLAFGERRHRNDESADLPAVHRHIHAGARHRARDLHRQFARRAHREAVERLLPIDPAGFPMKLPIQIGLFNSALVRASSPWWLPEAIINSAVRSVSARIPPACTSALA
jgi:pimeloyl-ACP methyl ester carboxylesterase